MKTYLLDSESELERYDYLARLSPDRWAWEYLRRNEDFRRDASVCAQSDLSDKAAPCPAKIRIVRPRVPQTLAERWGLVFMPDPSLDALEADAVWSHYVFPDQVEVNCTPREDGETCDIWERTVPHCDITHVTDCSAREYLLIRGKGCIAQVRCTGMSLLSIEPVRIKFQISDMDTYERRLKIRKEAMKLYGDGPDTSKPLWTKSKHILRNGIIALDCLDLGLSQRDIARVIYGAEAVEKYWGEDGSCIRGQTRYVIKKAEGLRDGGYLVELLGTRIGRDA